MERLPAEVTDAILENVWSLDDLGALSLVSRQVGRLCSGIRSKTLWRITYRTCLHEWGTHWGRSTIYPALIEEDSILFKVRRWLHRRDTPGPTEFMDEPPDHSTVDKIFWRPGHNHPEHNP